jgi:hypothetical protein
MTEAEFHDVELFNRIVCTVTGVIFVAMATIALILQYGTY